MGTKDFCYEGDVHTAIFLSDGAWQDYRVIAIGGSAFWCTVASSAAT